MADKPTQLRLGEIVVVVIDNRGKTPPWGENEPIELIETASIVGDNKYPDYSLVQKRVSQETHDNWFRGHPRAKDILIATVGANIGNLAIMRESRGCVAQNLVGLRIDENQADPEYVYYFLIWEPTKIKLKNLDIGAAQPSIKVPHLLDIDISLPPLPQQHYIAGILGELDDKIELNRRMNHTLESMARAVFRQWFVENEDVENWEVGKLGDLVTLINERVDATPEKDNEKYIALDDMPSKSIDLSQYRLGSDVNSSITRFRNGDILFGSMRPYFHKVGIAPFDGITRTTTFTLRPKKDGFRAFALYWFFSDEVIEYSTTASVGTTIPYVRWETLENYEIPIPPHNFMEKFTEFFQPLWLKIVSNGKESRTLASLRDSLLPKLMRGEVRLQEVKEVL
jgi:type I restriction enzyme S subunit